MTTRAFLRRIFDFRVITMRLLHTKKLVLKEFIGNKVPHYPILSHTWGDEEVTLQDMMTNEAMGSKGYEKVRNACTVAAVDEFEYIWIDTCCIDKTSSAELSEALNSMYRWYEEAKQCYAYLEDVPRGTIDRRLGRLNDNTIDWLRKSRWFTRGWTLQELIAPSTVIFLDREWRAIGSKSTLQELISEITRIPGGFLLGDDLGHASIAQRMSWASKRETTRVEDRAYCLTGLFGIYMPMLYGEGERAFIRLQEEIIRISDDHSLFAWRSTENHGGILATSPFDFADSSNIIQTNLSDSANNPPTLSSRGIYLSLRFKNNDSEGSGLAILHCTEVGKERMRLAIHLRDIFLTNKDFEREKGSMLEVLDLEDIMQYPPADLYVRQWRSTRDRKWGNLEQWENMEKCAIKFEGVGKEEVALHTTYLHSNWELHDGMIISTIELPPEGILGQLLVTCKDGNSFQVVVKKCGRGLSADIHTGFHTYLSNFSGKQQNERHRIVRPLEDGRHVHIAIKMRILMLHKRKHLVGVMEIGYSSTLPGLWVKNAAMLEAGIKERTLLLYAAKAGHEAVIKLLLGLKQVDIDSEDSQGLTPLSWAAANWNPSITKLLLEHGASMEAKNRRGLTPLLWAAEKGRGPMAKLLLGHGADREAKDTYGGRTPLALAAANGNRAIVQLLLDRGAELEVADASGRKPLVLAAAYGREAIVKLLLKKGADLETKDNYKRTPLIWAAMNGHGAVVQLLLNHVANKEAKDSSGRTPLLRASENGHEAVVRLLLSHSATLEAKDNSNLTPLLCAAEKGHEAVVQLLLNHGANQEAKDSSGRTPLELAVAEGRKAVIPLLLKKGAKLEARDDPKDEDADEYVDKDEGKYLFKHKHKYKYKYKYKDVFEDEYEDNLAPLA